MMGKEFKLNDETMAELMPLYEEYNRLMGALGHERVTFEFWYRMMLTLGSHDHKEEQYNAERGQADLRP